MASDTPIVFFNRQPVDEDMKRWNRLYYVGVDPKESAILEGEMFVDQYKKDPSLFDIDGDKSISYVLLEGEYSHQDSLIRTEWSVKTLKDGGVPIKKLTGAVANWERNQASALMEQWLKSYPDKIELVLSNNDDMALGAIDAIDRVGDTRGIKVIGIDGTPQAIEAINEGKMLGSVEFNKEEYAKAIFDIAATEALGGDVDSVIKLEDGKYYNAQQKIVIKNQ